MFDIQEELKKLPARPGVYLMHNAQDEIIYVGKARVLKNRVRQYFQTGYNRSVKIEHMVSHIAYFEYIITDSELEALVLECNLIKEHRPHYNTMLKDDKSYPYIRVTVQEEYPRILFCRNVKRDKSRYFGPYTSAGAVKETIELMHKVYKIRNCSRVLPRDIGKERACLYHQIGQCQAPCQGLISKEEYRKNVDQALRFLNGDDKKILRDLEEKMQAAAENLEFEDAAEYRDLMNSVKRIGEKQKINDTGGEDRDIIAMAKEGDEAVVSIFLSAMANCWGGIIFTWGESETASHRKSSWILSSSSIWEPRSFPERFWCRRRFQIGKFWKNGWGINEGQKSFFLRRRGEVSTR